MKRRFLISAVIGLILLQSILPSCAKQRQHVASLPLCDAVFSSASGDPAIRITDASRQTTVVSEENLQLKYDPAIGAVSVLDTDSGISWNTIPSFGNTQSAVLNVSLLSAKGSHLLNSQDNSVAYGTYNIRQTEDGLIITYIMSDTAEIAQQDFNTLKKGDLYLAVPVCFRLFGGELHLTINCAEILVSDGYIIESLSVLPYFGALLQDGIAEIPQITAADEAQTPSAAAAPYRAFLLVPDGCGAVMYTDTDDAATNNITLPISNTGEHNAAVGCFGIGKQGGAMAGTVVAGEQIASVKAQRSAVSTDAVNTVYPAFSITPVREQGSNYIYAAPYQGEIGVTYQFLTGNDLNAMDLAAACRETLTRSGALTGEMLAESVFPLNVSMIMSVTGEHATRATGIAQAEELAGVLKAKGVDQLNMVLTGLFDNGLYQNVSASYSALRMLGGSKALSAFSAYAASQNIDLYAGVNLLFADKASQSAADIDGATRQVFVENPLAPYVSTYGELCYLADAEQIDRNTVKFLSKLKKYNLTGYAVNDIAYSGYTDYSSGREDTDITEALSQDLSAVSAQKKLILSSADFSLIKHADVILNTPMYTTYTESAGYLPAPLIPALLHGSIVYAGGIANHESIYILELLKSVEYGASFQLGWNFLSGSHLFYELTYSDIAEYYVKTLSALGDLSARRITDHTKIAEGVYATVYEGGSTVYVNYNNHSVNIGTISVPPYDYLRIG